MTILDMPVDARAVVRARQRRELDELDYRRGLKRLEEQGFSQREISRWVGIAQPTVSKVLRAAQTVSVPPEGFSGATPKEICERYAAGFISREQLVDELVRFPYVQEGKTDGYDWLTDDPPGTWSEVSVARRRGLIDSDVYKEVFDRFREAGV